MHYWIWNYLDDEYQSSPKAHNQNENPFSSTGIEVTNEALLHNTPENINKLFSDPQYVDDYYCTSERLERYGEAIRLFVDEANVDFEKKRIADVGCGTGHALKYIHDNYKHGPLYGYDYSSAVLKIAKETLPIANYVLHDLDEPLDKDFDIIIGFQVFEHLHHPSIVLKNIRGALKSDGLIFLTIPNGMINGFFGHINKWLLQEWMDFSGASVAGIVDDFIWGILEKEPLNRFTSYDLAGPDPNPMTVDEVKYLKELVRWAQPKIIINIGAERGTSTLAMLEEVPNATIYSIDISPCEAEFENLAKAGFDADRVIRLLGRSQSIGKAWTYEVDFIWIDGDHSYEAVRADIEAWFPHLKHEGIIAFHDYFEGDPPAHNPSGAGRAVRETMGSYELVLSYERIRAFKK